MLVSLVIIQLVNVNSNYLAGSNQDVRTGVCHALEWHSPTQLMNYN